MSPASPRGAVGQPAPSPYAPTSVPPPGLPGDPRESYRPEHASTATPLRPYAPRGDNPSSRGDGRGETAEIARRHTAYQLRREVGRGTFGEVWEAVQLNLNRIVAVKRPRVPDAVADSDGHPSDPAGPTDVTTAPSSNQSAPEALFRREGLIAAGLDHPNIVPVYDLGAGPGGQPLLAMKLVEGRVWDDALEADRALDTIPFLQRHLPVLASVARAVTFAHSRGVVHRDLKPAQVMVGHYGEVYLMDWGLAIAMEPAATPSPDGKPGGVAGATPHDAASNPAGTVAFMAPEQTENSPARLGPWTDVYLLGGILYFILTGTRPHDQDSGFAAFHHAARGVVDPPTVRAPGQIIPEELADLATRAMAREPADRVASAAEFGEAVEAWLTGTARRAESRAMTQEAVACLEGSGATTGAARYETLDSCDRAVQRALGAWPDNPEAVDLKRRIAGEFAEAAMAEGDLELASAQAARIDLAQRRESVLARVGAARRAAARLARRRRNALIGAFVLMFGVASLGVVIARNAGDSAATEARLSRLAAETQATADLADRRRAIETARAEAAADRARLLSQTARAVEVALNLIPLPMEIDPADDWAVVRLTLESTATAEFAALLADLDALRARAGAAGVPPPPEPYEILFAKGVLALHAARATSDTRTAYNFLHEAALADPARHEAPVGLAVAAARAGDFDLAVVHAQQAMARVTPSSRYDFCIATELVNRIHRARWPDTTFPAGDVALTADPTDPAYTETPGQWKIKGGAKVGAYGLFPAGAAEGRTVEYYVPFAATAVSGTAGAEFRPASRPGAPPMTGRRHVYVAWSAYANARPVYYRVRHSAGDTTVALVQDGYGTSGASNGHFWTPLGAFDFTGAPDEGVTVAVGDDVRPLTEWRTGTVEAGAVAFTASPLDQGVTGTVIATEALGFPQLPGAYHAHGAPSPPGAVPTHLEPTPTPPEIEWLSDLAQSRALSAADGRPMLVFARWPVSSAFIHPLNRGRDYCEKRLFRHPDVRRQVAGRYIAVKIDVSVDPESAKAFGAETGMSLSLCDPGGAVSRRLAGSDLFLSPAEFSALLERTAASK